MVTSHPCKQFFWVNNLRQGIWLSYQYLKLLLVWKLLNLSVVSSCKINKRISKESSTHCRYTILYQSKTKSLAWIKYSSFEFKIETRYHFISIIYNKYFIFPAGVEEEVDHALDVAVHGVNSIIMFLLLLSSSLPVRLLHIYQPLLFGVTYMLFGLFYYLGGGTDR